MIAASLVQAKLDDRFVGFTAGLTLGADGTPGIGALGLDRLSVASRFKLVESQPVGGDIMHVWERS